MIIKVTTSCIFDPVTEWHELNLFTIDNPDLKRDDSTIAVSFTIESYSNVLNYEDLRKDKNEI